MGKLEIFFNLMDFQIHIDIVVRFGREKREVLFLLQLGFGFGFGMVLGKLRKLNLTMMWILFF